MFRVFKREENLTLVDGKNNCKNKYILYNNREAKTYQHANNVGVKKSYLGLNLCKILRCIAGKWVMMPFCAFWWHFLAPVGTLCYFLAFFCIISVFWAFYSVLSWTRFVVIYALLWVKYFWLKPWVCKKVVFLHVCILTMSMKYLWNAALGTL